MARFHSFVLLALLSLVLLSPLLVRPSCAIIATADEAKTDAASDDAAAAAAADADVEDDASDVKVEDDEDEEEEDDEDPAADSGADDAAEPPKPDTPAVIDPEGEENASGYSAPSGAAAAFFDDFQSGLSKWEHSSLPDYNGEFKVGQGAKPTIKGDRALIIPQKARKYGISAKVPDMLDLSSKPLVVQYELKLEDGMTCGGAYLKLPIKGFEPTSFNGDTPYSIMFGPDKCGATDKVHFIFQSENPKTGKRVEHHLEEPPSVANSYDKKTHHYMLIVQPGGKFEMRIDGEKKKEGKLSDNFQPPVQPPKQIDDEKDEKPSDWVDEKKIADPEAKKPDDWDEDAPAQIPDEDAKKPDGWLDDEPAKIADPEAKKPDGWSDEDDGEWKPKMIDNPKCAEVGCGEWKPPMKTNPAYKGKWKAPMIDNPKYVGEWKPRKIDNPDYYDAGTPSLLGIAGVGIEVWTMDQGVLFDNIWIGSDVKAAEAYSAATFVKKQDIEVEAEKKEEKEAEKEDKAESAKSSKVPVALGFVMDRIEDYLGKVERALEPVETWLVKQGLEPYLDKMIDLGINKPMIVVVGVPLMFVSLFLMLIGGGKKDTQAAEQAAAAERKKTDAVTEDVAQSEIKKDGKDDESEAPSENIDSAEPEKSETVRRRVATAD